MAFQYNFKGSWYLLYDFLYEVVIIVILINSSFLIQCIYVSILVLIIAVGHWTISEPISYWSVSMTEHES